MTMRLRLSRRQFLKTSGVLVVVGFSMTGEADSYSKAEAQKAIDSSDLDSGSRFMMTIPS